MQSGTTSPSTSFSLIRQARALDPEAWRTLSRLYGPLVYRWARQYHLQAHDAADVVQNVFVSVFRGIGKLSLEGPQASFRGWLWTITRNRVRELARQRVARPLAAGGSDAHQFLHELPAPMDDTDTGESPIPSADETESGLAHRALELVRETLDPRTWEAFRRTTLHEEPATQVAADLGMTSKAVRQAKYRVLCRLRELLADN